MSNPQTMPVSGEWSRRDHKHLPSLRIPWEMLVPHDAQAKQNHAGQDLLRLWERGGLGACEAIAILDDRAWTPLDTNEAHEELDRRIQQWQHSQGATESKSVWSEKLPDASGWWWIRGLNSHPPVQIVAVQQVCGVWAAMIWNQWRPVTDYEGCEWSGPLVEPTDH